MTLKLSLSRWSVFRQCPYRYKLKYVDWVTPSREIGNKHLSFGATLHTVLAEYHRMEPSQRTLRRLFELVEQKWQSRGYASEQEEAEYKDRAQKMLQPYHFDPQDRGETLLIEETMILRSSSGRGEFSGRVDRVVRTPDGVIEIIDYKTGRYPEADPEVDRPQLLTYALLYRPRLKPGDLLRTASAYYLEGNRKISFPVTENGLKEAGANLAEMFRAADAEKEFAPRPSGRCRYDCEYYGEVCLPDEVAAPVEERIDF